MSGVEAILYSALAFGAMWACYQIGKQEGEMRANRRRRERKQRWEEFED